MAQTFNDYIVGSSGQAGPYSYSFPVIASTDIKVSVNNVDKTLTSDYTLDTGNTRITFVSGKEPSQGDKVVVYRNTAEDPISSEFESGSTIRSTELNENFKQLLYISQEADYEKLSRIQPAIMEVDLQMGPNNKIIFEGTSDDARETTLTVVDPTADRTITIPNITGTVVTTGDTGTVTSQMILDDTILNADVNPNAEIAVSKLANSSTNRQLLETNGTNVQWASNIDIPGTLDVSGAVDLDSSLNVDGATQLQATGVDGNFDVNTNKFTVNAATGNTTIAGTLSVTGDLDCANLSIDTAELANNAVTAAKLANNSVASANIIDGSIVNADVNASAAIDGTKISPNFGSQNIVTSGTINVGNISGGSVVTTGTSTSDTKVYSAKRSDELYFNISTGDTIKDGDTFPDNDTSIATTAAINDRIIDLVDDVGGFWPIANETSFPSANPDVNNGPGTIVSIKALNSAITTTSNTTHVINNGAGSGNNVTITNLATNTTYAASMGLLVETTSTLHTYAFHRLVPKATEVTTVSGSIANVNTVAGSIANVNTAATNISNINTVAANNTNVTNVGSKIAKVESCADNLTDIQNYADTYQIKTSAPTAREDSSSLAQGDLWFDSSSNKQMMVYDGSSGDGYSAMSPSQSTLDDIAVVSGNITYTEDLGLITNALTTGTGNSIETCADNITKIQTCHTNIANINAVAADQTDIGAVAGKATEIGRLGTAAAVADLAILGTTDVVADMNTLATADVVSDMNTLATADIVADMNTLATADIVSDMNTLATSGNVTAMDNCSGSISNINTVSGAISNVNTTATNIANVNTTAGISANVTTVAGISANVTTVAGNNANVTTVAGNNANVTAVGGSISNVNTVAGSIADVNRYANEYKIAASAPGSPSEGDLWYDDTNNVLKYRDNSSWNSIAAGIANIDEDTSPSLGGHLDCTNKNLTNVGTVSGTNLTLDFGTL